MKKAQDIVKKFVKARGWEKQLPDHVAKSIAIEAAELLEIFQWGSPTAADIKNNPALRAELQGELADVLIYSLEMAIVCGLDAEKIIKAKLDFAGKKYPAELVRKHSAGDRAAHERYLQIKKAYRQHKKN